jgi:arabinan endo-1,5-alpha-L-arabinosidase
VFTNAPAWTTEAVPGNRNASFWAPDIIHLKDRYWVYYSVSTFGKNTSAIGVVSNPTLDPSDPHYQWTDHGPVVQSHQPSDYNAIDLSVLLDPEGKLWMVFGSFWRGIQLLQLDPATGKRLTADSPLYTVAHADSIEAACLYYHDRYYYLFVRWSVIAFFPEGLPVHAKGQGSTRPRRYVRK